MDILRLMLSIVLFLLSVGAMTTSLTGTPPVPCDDGDACTINDMYVTPYDCVGTLPPITTVGATFPLPGGADCATQYEKKESAYGPMYADCVVFVCDNHTAPGVWHWTSAPNFGSACSSGIGACDACGRCIATATSPLSTTEPWPPYKIASVVFGSIFSVLVGCAFLFTAIWAARMTKGAM